MSRPSPVLSLASLSLTTQAHGENFAARFASLTGLIPMKRLGARLVEVPPGKRAWPFHCHHANDEIFVILEGRGVLRLGMTRHPLEPGDIALCPAGGAESAHQIINTGEVILRYLAFSSMHEPDIMEYPDSGKVTAFAGAAPGGDKSARSFAMSLPLAAACDYWEGEDGKER